MTIDNIEKKTLQLMREHGLHDWTLEFDRATSRLGICRHSLKRIGISREFAVRNPWHQVRLTVLHEIAHALSPTNAGHNRVWKEKFVAIGGVEKRDYTVVKSPPKKFKGKCPSCKKVVESNRRSNSACYICCKQFNHGQYTDRFRLIWRRVNA